MARDAIPNFAGGPSENGSDWLVTLEAHFMDREWEGADYNDKRCKYFKLHLRGEARRRYDGLPDDTKNNWDLLYAKWTEWYPRAVTVSHEQSHLQQFRSMRLELSKMAKPIAKDDGSTTWETAKFVERLRHCASGITLLTDDAKGVDAYANLPPVVKDQLPKYAGLGPSLTTLSLDLLSLNHYEIASCVQQNLAIQDQLNTLLQSLSRASLPRSQIPTNIYSPVASNAYSPNPVRYSAQRPIFNRPPNDHQRSPYTRNPPFSQAPPTANFRVHPPAGSTPIPTSFPSSAEGNRQYTDAVRLWDTRYGSESMPTIETKYPLTPGSLSAGSGECWRCGLRHQGHLRNSSECLKNPALPRKEQSCRSLVDKSMRDVVKGVRTLAANHIESGNFQDFLQMHGVPFGSDDHNTPGNTDLFHIEGYETPLSYEYPYDGYDYNDNDQQGNGIGDVA